MATGGVDQFPSPGVLAAALLLDGALSLGWRDLGAPAAVAEARSESTEAEVEAALSEKGRPVVIEFSAQNCTSCRKLEREVLAREDVKRALSRFRVFKVDTYWAPGLKERFSIRGTPTVVFVDSAGRWREDLTAVGFVPAEEFLRRLEQVR